MKQFIPRVFIFMISFLHQPLLLNCIFERHNFLAKSKAPVLFHSLLLCRSMFSFFPVSWNKGISFLVIFSIWLDEWMLSTSCFQCLINTLIITLKQTGLQMNLQTKSLKFNCTKTLFFWQISIRKSKVAMYCEMNYILFLWNMWKWIITYLEIEQPKQFQSRIFWAFNR